jgi:hypothetical protein
MAEKRVKIPFPDQNAPGGVTMIDGSEVPITESTERWTELRLEDGTVLRVKPNVMSAVRIDGRYDQDGNPMYAVKGAQTMMIVSAPEHLRKDAKVAKVQ